MNSFAARFGTDAYLYPGVELQYSGDYVPYGAGFAPFPASPGPASNNATGPSTAAEGPAIGQAGNTATGYSSDSPRPGANTPAAGNDTRLDPPAVPKGPPPSESLGFDSYWDTRWKSGPGARTGKTPREAHWAHRAQKNKQQTEARAAERARKATAKVESGRVVKAPARATRQRKRRAQPATTNEGPGPPAGEEMEGAVDGAAVARDDGGFVVSEELGGELDAPGEVVEDEGLTQGLEEVVEPAGEAVGESWNGEFDAVFRQAMENIAAWETGADLEGVGMGHMDVDWDWLNFDNCL
ncbi:hypothetical protein MBLNU230_g1615t1 [Neophaeotheca triangularis]